jgi:predicted PurR-regulated permease PerM
MDGNEKVYNINISSKTIKNFVLIAVVIVALITLKSLVFVILTSVVLASFIRTAATSLKKHLGITRILSIVVMYLLTFLILAGIIYFFVPLFLVELSNILPVIVKYLPNNLSLAQNFDIGTLQSAGQIGQVSTLGESIKSFLTVMASGFENTLAVLFGSIINVGLVIVISFYLSVSQDGIESFLKILSPLHHQGYVIDLWNRSQVKIARWMQGQLVLGFLVGFLIFLGLSILRVEQSMLLSVIAAIFELIPFGIFLAIIPAISLTYISGGLSLSLMVLGLYLIVQQLESYLISPLVVHKVTGVSPLVVILSVLIGVNLAGFWGLILAVPVAVTILEYVKDLEKDKVSTV